MKNSGSKTPRVSASTESPIKNWRGVLIVLALLILPMFLGVNSPEWFGYKRQAVLDGQWYRLITSHFVHAEWKHTGFSLFGILALLFITPVRPPDWRWVWQLAMTGLGVCLGILLFQPQIEYYLGLSGAFYGLLVIVLVEMALRKERLAWPILTLLAAKMIWEYFVGVMPHSEMILGGQVSTAAHLYGVTTALLYLSMTQINRRS